MNILGFETMKVIYAPTRDEIINMDDIIEI